MSDSSSPGSGESTEPFDAKAKIKVGPDGRLLIPAAMRKAAGLAPGETVIVELKGEEIVLSTYSARIRKVQKILAKYKKPGESIVDEFIAERRAEAAREEME